MKKHGLCYLATPYTAYERGHEAAFIEAAQIAARLAKVGMSVYCPISMTHPMTVFGNLKGDHDYWMEFNQLMLEACHTLIVAQMDGWEFSRGVECEIEYFTDTFKPVLYLDTETLSLGANPSPLARMNG